MSDAPDNICCPITYEIFEDPVILSGDGHTYERSAIESYLKCKSRSPMTNEDLTVEKCILIRNISMVALVDKYKQSIKTDNHCTIRNFFKSSDPKMTKCALRLKIQLLGDSGVGKTRIRKYFQFNESRETLVTMGLESSLIQLKCKVKKNVIQIEIYDICGQFDRFHCMLRSSYHGIHAALLVCSVDISDSVENLKYHWWPELEENGPDFVYGMVLVNKCDLLHSNCEKDIFLRKEYFKIMKEAKDFASVLGWPLYNTSAVSGQYIHIALKELIDILLEDENIWGNIMEKKNMKASNVIFPRIKVEQKQKKTKNTVAFQTAGNNDERMRKKGGCCFTVNCDSDIFE